jgi:hypothetical protein
MYLPYGCRMLTPLAQPRPGQVVGGEGGLFVWFLLEPLCPGKVVGSEDGSLLEPLYLERVAGKKVACMDAPLEPLCPGQMVGEEDGPHQKVSEEVHHHGAGHVRIQLLLLKKNIFMRRQINFRPTDLLNKIKPKFNIRMPQPLPSASDPDPL